MDIPKGWKRGATLLIEKRASHNATVIVLAEAFDFSLEPGGALIEGHVACIYFETWEEVFAFLKWWYS